MITQEELKELLQYDEITGNFIWLMNRCHKAMMGDIAGSLINNGYLSITVNRKKYVAHRLAWLYVYGYLPDKDLDHINGIRSDNRISNLRECTRSENMENQKKPHSNNKLGILGVSVCRSTGKYLAQICINKKRIRIGLFKSASEASIAYKKYKEKHHKFAVI